MALRQKQEYETETLPDQRRQEDEKITRDRDLENAFSRWKKIAELSQRMVWLLMAMLAVVFIAACSFAYLWMTVAPMPIVFHHSAEGQVYLAQVGWPKPDQSVLKTKAGLQNLFSRMRHVLYDRYSTKLYFDGVPPFLTVRAQNMLAAFNAAHPIDTFFERRMTRRVYKFDARQDPNTPFLYHVQWKEEVIDSLGRRATEPVEVTAKVWTVAGATCPQTIEQAAANPDCIVVDSWEWNVLN
jgi:type IV secretory pathway TrbF-like protein